MEVPTYDLPESAIAQRPVEPRDSARLLDATDPAGAVVHRSVSDLPLLVRPGDVLVVNSSRVIPARLRLRRSSGGAAEVLLLEPSGREDAEWTALVRPGRRLPPGEVLVAEPGAEAVVEVGERLDDGRRRVRLLGDPHAVLERWGTVALPPYIGIPLQDPERYQTVYADRPGSVAAPTAGLHLTSELLRRCESMGAAVAKIDLAVGLATFRPIEVEDAADHRMHAERYSVTADTLDACRTAPRVIAVGTTALRALEAAASTGVLAGETDLYVHGTFPFAVVDVLLTNFHLPRSSLLVLLEAFCGRRWRSLYATALAHGYRFLSFGDAMVVSRLERRENA